MNNEMIIKYISQKCKRHRERHNITVPEIAKRSGYSQWNVYDFEHGKRNNMTLLLCYMSFGLKLSEIEMGVLFNENVHDERS